MFESKASDQSVTKKSQFYVMEDNGKQLLVVDTPPLFGTFIDENPMWELAKIIGMTYPGFHAMIVVIKIGRFTKQENNAFGLIERLFGPEVFNRIILLFTGLDNLEADDMLFHDYVSNHIRPELKQIASKCGNRVVGFDNRANESTRKQQVQELLDIVERVYDSTKAKGPIYDTIWRELKGFFEKRHSMDQSKSKADLQNEIRHEIEKDNEHNDDTRSMLQTLENDLNTKIEQTSNTVSRSDRKRGSFCVLL